MSISNIDILHESETTRIIISGYFDFNLTRSFLNRISSIDLNKPVMVDFNECEYIDSSGLGCLLKLNRMLQENGQKLSHTGGNQKITYVLKMMELS